MDRIARFGIVAGVIAIALIIPTRGATQTPPPVIEVFVTLTDLPPAVVNVTADGPAITLPELPAPVVNVTVPKSEPSTITVQPAPVLPPEIVYRDRIETVTVEVEVPVETIIHCDAFNSTDRQFAFITDGVVTNIAAGNGPSFQSYLNAVAGQGRETTCVFPKPGIGWTWDGEVFAPPS